MFIECLSVWVVSNDQTEIWTKVQSSADFDKVYWKCLFRDVAAITNHVNKTEKKKPS